MIAALVLTAAVHAVAPAGVVVVRGEVPQVLVVAGDVRVEGRVLGNVVVVLGDVVLGPQSQVEGDLVVFGGSVVGVGKVRGKSWVLGGRSPAGFTSWAWVLVRMGLWVLVSFFLVTFFPRTIRRGAEVLAARPMASLVSGLGFLLVWLSLAVLVGITVFGPLSLVLWAMLAVTFLGLKALGLGALAWVVGRGLRRWLPVSLRGEIPRTGLAMASVVLLSALPSLGAPLWVLANVLALGGAWLGLAVGWPVWQKAEGKVPSGT